MEYQELKECAKYSNLRTSTFTKDTYISTENMLPNKGGVTSIDSIPTCKTTAKYESSDILISNIRPYFCKIWFATREGGCSNDVLVIKAKKTIEPKFLYYVLSDKNFFNYDTITSKGTKMPRGNKNAIMKYLVPKFSPLTQQKISSILSAYDRLIENNTRRIRLLEQMAENLYKEWFAYHKIKGQSTAVKLKEVVSITRGLSYSSEEIDCTDGNNLINLKNIQGYGGFRLDGTKLYNGKYKPEQIVEEGDLIMGVTDMTQDRRTVGSVALIPNVNTLSVISADLVKINSSIDNTYLYAMFRYGNVSRHIAQFANGANVLHLRPKSILNIKVFLPNQDIIDSFVSKVKPMIQLTNRLNTEIDSLTRQRDLLLPRLMSGKLEVKS
ncbi:restriction endonuclease subunit S [Prevotella melaninogenica]